MLASVCCLEQDKLYLKSVSDSHKNKYGCRTCEWSF